MPDQARAAFLFVIIVIKMSGSMIIYNDLELGAWIFTTKVSENMIGSMNDLMWEHNVV
jgi:hypothetical protein